MQDEDVRVIAANHPLFAALPPEDRRTLVAAGRVVRHRAKSTILSEGDTTAQVYFLCEGAVRVFHRRARREIVVKLFRAPAMFGEMEVLAALPTFLEYVTALERSITLQIAAPLFRRAVEKRAGFAFAVARDVSRRLCVATVNERALIFDDVGPRLCALLADYVDLSASPRIELPLSQESLARDLGLSRRAVVNALDRLKQDGIVEKKAARYVVKDLQRLKERADRSLGLFYFAG